MDEADVGELFSQSDFEVREWFKDKQFILGTEKNLPEIMDACIASGKYSLDLETTGLDNRVFLYDGVPRTKDLITGVCVSPDGVRGFYIPIRHVHVAPDGSRVPLECNIPMPVFDREFRRLIKATDELKTVAIFHHGKFDQEFLEFNGTGEPYGEWDKPKAWEDTIILAYLRNTRERNKGLKHLSNQELGIDQVELDELYPKGYKGVKDFSTLDPTEQETLWYAGGDAICTFLLFDKLIDSVIQPDTDGASQKGIYGIEKGCVAATRWMERNRIHINRQKIGELIVLGHKEWYASITETYEEACKILGRDVMPGKYAFLKEKFVADDPTNGIAMQMDRAEHMARNTDSTAEIKKGDESYPTIYDIHAPPQLGRMFQEMEVPGLTVTEKSGQVKTSKDELDAVIERAGDKFPFMKKVKRFREIDKALSTYLYPMYLDSEPTDDTMRINFKADKVDTGRFSTPAKDSSRDKMVGWPQVNAHSIPKTGDPNRPACMDRLRECISARPVPEGKPPKFVVAIDYAGVELRLVTNLSREPKWLAEFFHCSGCDRTFERGDGTKTPEPPPPRCPNCGSDKIGDLHTLTGLSIFGADAQSKDNWKVLRGHAKGTNFALCYGGGGSAVCRSTGVDKNEGSRIKNQFDATYSGLKRWWDITRNFARKHKFVRTAFKRKYPVPDIDSPDRGFQSKAERNAVNGPIQGSSADITKTAMALIYKEMKNRDWLDKVQMTITMHDELVFEIDGDVLEEVIPLLVNLMTRNNLIISQQWPIPLTCDVEIGYDWTVPWDINGMRYGEVKFFKGKKYKDRKKLPEGADWDTLSSWPDDLKPWFKEARGEAPVQPAQEAPPPAVPPVSPVPEAPANPAPAEAEGESYKSLPPELVAEVLSAMPTPVTTPKPEPKKADLSITPIGHPASVQDNTPVLAPGAVFEYHLQASLSMDTLDKLARIIAFCMGRGTNPLRLISRNGTSLDDFIKHPPFNGTAVRVNPAQFYILAQHDGI